MGDANVKKKSSWGGLKIDDRESCARAIKNGGIAAMICAAVNSLLGVAGFFTSSSDSTLNYLLDPWILIDAVLLAVFGVFIFRRSRVAATLTVIYFAASKALSWAATGPKGLPLAIILFIFFVNAMRGTYIWYSKYGDGLKPMSSAPQLGAAH